ncbi:MAG: hypothetical protein Q9164_005275 [Protoblastenia rupestris]
MGSGDEGIIAQGRKKRRKHGKSKGKGKGKKGEAHGDPVENDDDNTAVGVRRRKRTHSQHPPPQLFDIDNIWARMNTPIKSKPPSPPKAPTFSPGKENQDPTSSTSPSKPQTTGPSTTATTTEETITIPHTYTFAGTTHTTQKTVPLSSSEAQAYLARQARTKSTRPLARKNLLEPNPSRLINGSPAPVRTDLPPSIGGNMEKGKKVEKRKKEETLNTVEKSKLDWEEEVRKQGLREELEQAGKSGGDYLGRMEFLGRVEGARDDREREERLKRMA